MSRDPWAAAALIAYSSPPTFNARYGVFPVVFTAHAETALKSGIESGVLKSPISITRLCEAAAAWARTGGRRLIVRATRSTGPPPTRAERPFGRPLTTGHQAIVVRF